MNTEARVSINGVGLNAGQVMTLRVAVSSFLSDMRENGLGDDEMGEKLTAGYIRNSHELEILLIGNSQ